MKTENTLAERRCSFRADEFSGGFEQIAPDAKLDDGKFSLIIVKTANIFEIVHLVALMMNGGKHINDRRLIYTKTSFLEVDAPEQVNRLMINLDGEYGGDALCALKTYTIILSFCKCRSNP